MEFVGGADLELPPLDLLVGVKDCMKTETEGDHHDTKRKEERNKEKDKMAEAAYQCRGGLVSRRREELLQSRHGTVAADAGASACSGEAAHEKSRSPIDDDDDAPTKIGTYTDRRTGMGTSTSILHAPPHALAKTERRAPGRTPPRSSSSQSLAPSSSASSAAVPRWPQPGTPATPETGGPFRYFCTMSSCRSGRQISGWTGSKLRPSTTALVARNKCILLLVWIDHLVMYLRCN